MNEIIKEAKKIGRQKMNTKPTRSPSGITFTFKKKVSSLIIGLEKRVREDS